MRQGLRTARVFISSTFRDMHHERNHLARFVFNELRERCRVHRIHLIDVDLRWGVSERDAHDGKALDICLDEIDNCRPYFIGMLGHRYGWVPDGHQSSITAQEIYHGVLHGHIPIQIVDLRKIIDEKVDGQSLSAEEKSCLSRCYQWAADKGKYLLQVSISDQDRETIRRVFERYSIYQKDRSFFFFRQESLTRRLAGTEIDDFIESDPTSLQKMEGLKKEIMESGLPYYFYDDLEAFGEVVLDVLWKRIQAETEQPVMEKDRLQEEVELHELFMADRTRRFVGRRDSLHAMQEFCRRDDEQNVLVISGEPGSGKSALMSRFAQELIHEKPEWLILTHFVGASPASTNVRQMLLRICSQFILASGSTQDVPEQINELTKIFAELLSAQKQKTVLILDAINQLEKSDIGLQWLPPEIPKNVRLVVSTLPGETHDAIVSRVHAYQEEVVKGLNPLESKGLVETYLKEIRHEFPNPQTERDFYDKVVHGNPLYILVALEELRLFGKFEQLSERIKRLPTDVPSLFDQVLERIESDFSRELVRDCMVYIACGRYGMTAEELQSLLKSHAPPMNDGQPASRLPDMKWARLYRSFSSYLFQRSGVIDFFHGQLKEATGRRYLKKETELTAAHRILADYFEARWKEPYSRALNEVPHQRTRAKDWEGLERVLCDISFIESKCSNGMLYDLIEDYSGGLSASKEAEWTGREKTENFSRFVHKDSHILSLVPALTFQQAANQPDNSAPAILAKTLLEQGIERRIWLQWVNKTQGSDPCVLTIKCPDGVGECRYSPDGKKILSSESSGLKLRDPRTGSEIRTLRTDSGGRCAFSPDGKRIITRADAYGSLKVLNAENGVEIFSLKGEGILVDVGDYTYSRDGKKILSLSGKKLRIWDAETGLHLADFTGHTDSVKACCYSPDGKWILSASRDKTLKLWDAETGKELRAFIGHTDAVNACDFSPNGRRILSGSNDKTLKIWDVETGFEIKSSREKRTSKMINFCAYSPDGKLILVPLYHDITLRDAETLEETAILQGHKGNSIYCCSFAPTGDFIISTADDFTIKIWDTKLAMSMRPGSESSLSAISDCIFSADNQKVASLQFGFVKIWNGKTAEKLCEGGINNASSILFSPRSDCIASAGKWICIWDVENLKEVMSMDDADANGLARFDLVYSPDGCRILSCETYLRVWDAETGKEIVVNKLEGPKGFCDLSPEGRRTVAFNYENYYRNGFNVWDIETGSVITQMVGKIDSASTYAFSPDGKRLATDSEDGNLRIWDTHIGKNLLVLGHAEKVQRFEYFPDGRKIICRGLDNSITIWDARSGNQIAKWSLAKPFGNLPSVNHLCSADGRTILWGDSENSLRILDAENGVALAHFYTDRIHGIAQSNDSRYLAIGDRAGVFHLLRLQCFEFGRSILTPVYIYRFDKKEWDHEPTSVCKSCGVRFTPALTVLHAIEEITKNANLSAFASPCSELPDEAWEDPGLQSECTACGHQVKFNPYIVDHR